MAIKLIIVEFLLRDVKIMLFVHKSDVSLPSMADPEQQKVEKLVTHYNIVKSNQNLDLRKYTRFAKLIMLIF